MTSASIRSFVKSQLTSKGITYTDLSVKRQNNPFGGEPHTIVTLTVHAPDWGKTKEALLLLEGALQGTFGRRTSLVPYWLMTNGSAISDSEWRRI